MSHNPATIELEDDGWDAACRPVIHRRTVPAEDLECSLYRSEVTDFTGRTYKTRYAGGGEVILSPSTR